jgi:hypothetical protein
MAELVDLLVQPAQLQLLFGKIAVVHGVYHDITYAAGVIKSVAKLDADTYSVDDYVAFLLGPSGGLILGKQTLGTPLPILPTPGSAVIVDDNAYGTYDSITGAWAASTLVQSPTQYGAWFYTPSAFTSLSGAMLASFEVEVTRTGGGPPEFAAHTNLSGSGTLNLTGQTYASEQPPLSSATWIRLPLDWGHQLISGTIKGIAVGGGMNSGTYSGTGRVRFQPV